MFRYRKIPVRGDDPVVAKLVAVAVALLALASAVSATPPPEHRFRAYCDADAHTTRDPGAISPDGVDFLSIKHLAATSPDAAEQKLRSALEACDPSAAQAIAVTKMVALRDELQDLLEPRRNFMRDEQPSQRYPRFRVQVVIALNAIDPAWDYSRFLAPLLAAPDAGVRLQAVMGARNFRAGGVRVPLLRAVIDRVRRDDDPLVRRHAADTALDMGNAVPPRLDAHPELSPLIAAPPSGNNTPRDFKRFARAAQRIERLIASRNR
ncbi:MAG TPA: hypothetical protein VN903_17950 [Polyangia bacterium]|jgi:hypothetical protein|nr:hypothetical protein [Polyangia bacterium]